MAPRFGAMKLLKTIGFVWLFSVFFFSLLISYAHSPTTGGNIETKDNCFCQLIIELIRCQPPFPAVRGQNAIRKSFALVGTVIGRTEEKIIRRRSSEKNVPPTCQ